MLTADDVARVQAIAARLADVIEGELVQRPAPYPYDQHYAWALHDGRETLVAVFHGAGNAALFAHAPDDIRALLQLVKRLTQGQARDEANIGIPF